MKTLLTVICTLLISTSVKAQDITITLAGALSPAQPKLPSIIGDDPNFLRASGIKGPTVKVQPLTQDEINKIEEDKRKEKLKAQATVIKQKTLTQPKARPIESTGRYLPTTEITENNEAPTDKLLLTKQAAKNGQYVVE